MINVSFTRIAPPGRAVVSEEYYRKGWAFADDALSRYGAEACERFRKTFGDSLIVTSYERGAIDRFDGKPHKYGK